MLSEGLRRRRVEMYRIFLASLAFSRIECIALQFPIYIYIYIFIFLQKLFSVGGFTVNDSRDPDRNGSTLVPVVAADLLSPMSILFATPDLAFEQ